MLRRLSILNQGAGKLHLDNPISSFIKFAQNILICLREETLLTLSVIMHSNKKAIPTFWPESEFDSDTQYRFFACPASGENVYTWKMDKTDYPAELLFISHGETI